MPISGLRLKRDRNRRLNVKERRATGLSTSFVIALALLWVKAATAQVDERPWMNPNNAPEARAEMQW